jgi:hypothetical protein
MKTATSATSLLPRAGARRNGLDDILALLGSTGLQGIEQPAPVACQVLEEDLVPGFPGL